MRVVVAAMAVVLAGLLVTGLSRGGRGGASRDAARRGAAPEQGAGHSVPLEGDYLVSRGAPTSYAGNPPASGAQLSDWAGWGIHQREVARGAWVHNLAHGGIVLAYRPDAPRGVIEAVIEAYREIPTSKRCGHAWTLVTPDPELEPAWAVIAWGHVLTDAEVDADAVVRFALAHRGRHQPHCAAGPYDD